MEVFSSFVRDELSWTHQSQANNHSNTVFQSWILHPEQCVSCHFYSLNRHTMLESHHVLNQWETVQVSLPHGSFLCWGDVNCDAYLHPLDNTGEPVLAAMPGVLHMHLRNPMHCPNIVLHSAIIQLLCAYSPAALCAPPPPSTPAHSPGTTKQRLQQPATFHLCSSLQYYSVTIDSCTN